MLYEIFIAPFEFAFMRRGLIGASALMIGSAPVGVFLVLRRMSLAGDALAHAILPGAALGYLIGGFSLTGITSGAMLAGMLLALTSGWLTRGNSLGEETTLASLYIFSLALGISLLSLTGSQRAVFQILFGTILSLDRTALLFLGGVATVSVATIAWFYRLLVLEILDPTYLSSLSYGIGWKMGGHACFFILLVINLVASLQALGSLMAVGLLVLPAACARLMVRDLGTMFVVSAVIGISAIYVGLIFSYHFSLPSGPSIILCAGSIYLFTLAWSRVRNIYVKI